MPTAEEILQKYSVGESTGTNLDTVSGADSILSKYGLGAEANPTVQRLQNDITKAKNYEASPVGKFTEKASKVITAPLSFLANAKVVPMSQVKQHQLDVAKEAIASGENPDAAIAKDYFFRLAPPTATLAASVYMPAAKAGIIPKAAVALKKIGAYSVAPVIRNMEDPESVPEAVKKGLSEGMTSTALDYGTAGLFKLANASGRAIALRMPHLTKQGFREAAERIKVPQALTENLLDKADDIMARAKQLDQGSYVENQATKLQSLIGSTKKKIGNNIDNAITNLKNGNKKVDTSDIVSFIDDQINNKGLPTAITEPLEEVKGLFKGKLTQKQVAILNRDLLSMTKTASGKPIVGSTPAIIANVRKMAADKLDDTAYKAAIEKYAQLAKTTNQAFGSRIPFSMANQSSDDAYRAIVNRLTKIGQEAPGGNQMLSPISRQAFKDTLKKIIPGSDKIYQNALDYNTYRAFYKKVPMSSGLTPRAGLGWINDMAIKTLRDTAPFTQKVSGLAEPILQKTMPAVDLASNALRRGVSQQISSGIQ